MTARIRSISCKEKVHLRQNCLRKILTKANVEHKEKFMKPEGVETIGAPIRLRKIEDVKMKLSFSPFGLFKSKIKLDATSR